MSQGETPEQEQEQEQGQDKPFPSVTCGSSDPPFCSHLFNFKRQLYDCIMYDTDASTEEGQDMSLLDDYRRILKQLYDHLMKLYNGEQDSSQFIQSMDQSLGQILARNNQKKMDDFRPLIQTTLTVVTQDVKQNNTKNSSFIKDVLITWPWLLSPVSEMD